ncbi:MAG TPA: hypothetical protein QF901_00365 [Gammaproteobacteria bacterium]|jgi:hypothetical protein|nr:hypothetical protein [Gammaproteobacteria bacterium]
MRLTLWGPAEQSAQYEVADESEVVLTLIEWCRSVGVRPSDVDYRIDDGLRVLGDPCTHAAGIDVCGLPKARDD